MFVGGGVLDAPREGGSPPLQITYTDACRAASPLAAVAVCGGGKPRGRIWNPPLRCRGRYPPMTRLAAQSVGAHSICALSLIHISEPTRLR